MSTEPKISYEEAIRLSIIKWKAIIDNGGKYLSVYPDEIENLPAKCGFCKRNIPFCYTCELFPKRICGPDYNTLYQKFDRKQTIENATAILDALIEMQQNIPVDPTLDELYAAYYEDNQSDSE